MVHALPRAVCAFSNTYGFGAGPGWLRCAMRLVALTLALLGCAADFAQGYPGTYTAQNPQGGTVTLTLKQAQKHVTGTLSGNGTTFDVDAQAMPEGLMGTVGNFYLMAKFEGASLMVILAEPGPGGQPNLQAARRLVFARATGKVVPNT